MLSQHTHTHTHFACILLCIVLSMLIDTAVLYYVERERELHTHTLYTLSLLHFYCILFSCFYNNYMLFIVCRITYFTKNIYNVCKMLIYTKGVLYVLHTLSNSFNASYMFYITYYIHTFIYKCSISLQMFVKRCSIYIYECYLMCLM